MSGTLTLEESKSLLALCRSGRLYEIEDWIRAGKSLAVAAGIRKTPLELAIETGFHSLIVLLARNEPRREVKNKALADAVGRRKLDMIELLVDQGADVSSIAFVDVLRTWDPKIIRYFLDRGADVVADRPFAVAFGERVRSSLRVFKECQESHPEIAGELKQQAERALRLFSYEGNLKWVSLMLWLGADPRVKGPRLDARSEDDPECDATAAEEACLSGKLEVLRRFKLVAGIDDLSGLLRDAAHFGHADIVGYLLDLGAEPNDKPNGGSSALDRCLWHLEFEDGDHLRYRKPITRYGVYHTIETLTILLKAGALWIPDDRGAALRFRRTLTNCEPALVLDLFKRFKAHGAVTPDTIREYLDTPQMQKHLAGNEWHLRRLGATVPPSRTSTYVPYGLLARFNREQLYEEVWSQPMLKLAAKYKVSDVALAKTCKKLKIPVPGRGYWAKLAAGKPPRERPPLPPFPIPDRR